MFIVRFIRRDRKPNEEYFYHTEADAREHFALFQDDDSELYSEIQLVECQGEQETTIDTIRFALDA